MFSRLLKRNYRNIHKITKRNLFSWNDPFKLTCLLNISEKTFEGGEFLLTTGLSKEIKDGSEILT